MTFVPDRKSLLVKRILVYPFTGPGAVNVTNGDLNRLDPQQFLNDTLIELWLKYVVFAFLMSAFLMSNVVIKPNCSRLMMADLRQSNPELADEVHVFSSFFYKKLDPKK